MKYNFILKKVECQKVVNHQIRKYRISLYFG